MTRNEALRLLGLDKAVVTLTPEIIREAFRAAARANHPDAGIPRASEEARKHIDLRDSPLADMHALTKAKEFLLKYLDAADFTCKLCGGLRMVRGKFGYRPCGGCNRDGDKQ